MTQREIVLINAILESIGLESLKSVPSSPRSIRRI